MAWSFPILAANPHLIRQLIQGSLQFDSDLSRTIEWMILFWKVGLKFDYG